MLELVTERLLLRDFAPGDVEAVHAYAGDPVVCRFTDWGPNTPAQSQSFVDEMCAASAVEAPDSTTWAVTVGGTVVGACSVSVTSTQHRRGAMGYVLARAHWGHGFATEAAAVVLRFAREDLGLQRVEATCRPGNTLAAGAAQDRPAAGGVVAFSRARPWTTGGQPAVRDRRLNRRP